MSEKKATVLIADDEESIRRALTKILESKYVVLESTKDGEEAVQLACTYHLDLILMDMVHAEDRWLHCLF